MSEMGAVMRECSEYVDAYDPPSPARLYAFARAHDAADAEREALLARLVEALEEAGDAIDEMRMPAAKKAARDALAAAREG